MRHGHHDLLQLGFGAEAGEPDLAARRVFGEVGGLVERVAGPGIQNRRQHHLVFQRRTGRTSHRLQSLERVRYNAAADDNLIRDVHATEMIISLGRIEKHEEIATTGGVAPEFVETLMD